MQRALCGRCGCRANDLQKAFLAEVSQEQLVGSHTQQMRGEWGDQEVHSKLIVLLMPTWWRDFSRQTGPPTIRSACVCAAKRSLWISLAHCAPKSAALQACPAACLCCLELGLRELPQAELCGLQDSAGEAPATACIYPVLSTVGVCTSVCLAPTLPQVFRTLPPLLAFFFFTFRLWV